MSMHRTPASIQAAAVAALSLVGLAAPARAQGGPDTPIPHRFVVRLAAGQTIDDIVSRHGGRVVSSDAARAVYVLEFPEDHRDNEDLMSLGGDGRMAYAEQELGLAVAEGQTQSFFPGVHPDLYADQFFTNLIGLPAAHRESLGGGITVAILDTGIAPHPALLPVLLPNGYNFVDDNADTNDAGNGVDDNGDGTVDEKTGHGTLMAGLVVIVAPEAQLLPVRVLNSDGVGSSFDIARGIVYAVDQGAKVINLSLITTIDSHVMEEAIEYARENGVIIVAALGNTNSDRTVFPAHYEGMIAVAATTAGDRRAPFSDFGRDVDVCAPGAGLVSTLPGGEFANLDGTSAAAAVVSGVAALVAGKNRRAEARTIRSIIRHNVVSIAAENPAFGGLLGVGRIAADLAVHAGVCPADLDDGAGGGVSDGAVDINDLVYYLGQFEAGTRAADLDDGLGNGARDGAVEINDLLYFLDAYENGC